jgi:hypothetical protein
MTGMHAQTRTQQPQWRVALRVIMRGFFGLGSELLAGAIALGLSASGIGENGADRRDALTTAGAAAEAAVHVLSPERPVTLYGAQDLPIAQNIARADDHDTWSPRSN